MLTDTRCRSAKPLEELYRLNDYKGLYLEVKPSGVKAWRYRFKLNGKDSLSATSGLGRFETTNRTNSVPESRHLPSRLAAKSYSRISITRHPQNNPEKLSVNY